MVTPRMETFPISIEAIWISPGHDFKGRHGQERLEHGVQVVDAVECHAGRGLVGDRYYDYAPDYKGQVTLFAAEAWEAFVAAMDPTPADPSRCRRNIMVRGLDLPALIGREFVLGGVVLLGVEEAKPCYWMDRAIAEGACTELKDRGGLRCRIVQSGTLNRGEAECQLR